MDNQFERRYTNRVLSWESIGIHDDFASSRGVWAVVNFALYHQIIQIHDQNPSNVLSLVCDNSSFVNTVNKIADRQRKQFPNETLEPDWDVINEIVSLIRFRILFSEGDRFVCCIIIGVSGNNNG